MTITTRQDKVKATIARVEARLAKLKAMTEEQIAKKYDDRFWYEHDIKRAEEQITDNINKLPEAKRLDEKEEAKIAKNNAKQEEKTAMPQIMKDFENELRNRFEKSWIEAWELLISQPYPKFGDRSANASAIRNAHRQTREEIVKEAEQTAEALVMNLWLRVQKKCGNVTELNGLYINAGNWMEGSAINGVVVGENGTATVKSIVAGGYNIQRLHVRVLVK